MYPTTHLGRAIIVVVAILLAGSALSAAVPGPRVRWIRLDTAHFTFFASATERATRALAHDLEELRAALQVLLPGAELRSPVPTFIYVFEDRIDFAPYRPIYGGRFDEVDGYFLTHADGNFMALNGDTRTNPRRTVFHEYLHEVERRNLPGLPLWLAEGLAEVYSSFESLADGTGIVGRPHRGHALLLQRQPLMPLAELLALGRDDRAYHRGGIRDLVYAQSWALTHYLLFDAAHRVALEAYLAALAAGDGDGADAAYARLFADPEAIDAGLRIYVRGRYPVAGVPLAAAAAETDAVALTVLPYHEVLQRLGDLLAHSAPEHAEAAGEHYRAALEVRPDHAPAIAGLGYLADRGGDLEQAIGHYRRAAATAPEDARLQYLHGQGLLRSLGSSALTPAATSDAQRSVIREARAALARSTALDPSFGSAWADLGFTYAVEAEPPPEAAQVLARAEVLLPERLDIAFNRFLVLTRLGARADAEALYRARLEPAASPEVLVQARTALLNLDIEEANRLADQGRYAALVPVLEKIVARADDPEVRAKAARQLSILSAADLRREVAPAPPEARYQLAVRLVAKGSLREAESILESLAAELPDGTIRDQVAALLDDVRSKRRGNSGRR